MDLPNVWAVEDVMARSARPGKRVLIIDDTGNWRGNGTAWHLAERGHDVTIVTPDPFIGRELVRTSADYALRAKLAELGVETIVNAVLTAWHGDSGTIYDFVRRKEQRRPFDSLVFATTNIAEADLATELLGRGAAGRSIGDCLAPRHAPAAIFEGRRMGLSL